MGSSAPHRCSQYVAAIANGSNKLRRFCICFQLATQPAYLRVDASIICIMVDATRPIKELFAAKHALRVFDKGKQQVKLTAGKGDKDIRV